MLLVEASELLLHQFDLLLRLLTVQPGVFFGLFEIFDVFLQLLPGLRLILQPAHEGRNPTIIVSQCFVSISFVIRIIVNSLVLEVLVSQLGVVDLEQQLGVIHGDVSDLRGMHTSY